jgi:hypothetical protein
MRNELADRPDPARPALIVTYGHTARKYRVLEREIVVVGRAPGCDVALASPEVAPVHCILAHGPHGWRVRDCSGRGGTHVNGTTVVEGPLKHGDTLQVGSFSFEAHLPAGNAAPVAVLPPVAPSAAMRTAEAPPPGAPADDEALKLNIRARELMLFADYLRRHEQEVNARLARRHEEVSKAEGTLREQRAEVVRLMTETAKAGQNARSKSDSTSKQDADALRSHVAMLRQELAGRDSIIAGMRVRLEQLERECSARGAIDGAREDLDRQREELSEQVALLEERRADLEELTREAELQAARERAQLARDRAELEQLLEDFRYEQERGRPEPRDFGQSDPGAATRPVVGEPPQRVEVDRFRQPGQHGRLSGSPGVLKR